MRCVRCEHTSYEYNQQKPLLASVCAWWNLTVYISLAFSIFELMSNLVRVSVYSMHLEILFFSPFHWQNKIYCLSIELLRSHVIFVEFCCDCIESMFTQNTHTHHFQICRILFDYGLTNFHAFCGTLSFWLIIICHSALSAQCNTFASIQSTFSNVRVIKCTAILVSAASCYPSIYPLL